MSGNHFLPMDSFASPLKTGVTVGHLHDGRPAKPHKSCLRSQLILLAMLSFTLASCASNAEIVNETPTGGTVLYSYFEEQDVLTSAGRKDALRLLGEKCPGGYSISREGQLAQIDKAVDRAWMGQVSRDGQPNREKRWAIQFACK
jgi:hypothetical protein